MPELQKNIVDDLASVTTESWRTFRIMAEMVEALDTLNSLTVNCISIFGSARCTPDTQVYQEAMRGGGSLIWLSENDLYDEYSIADSMYQPTRCGRGVLTHQTPGPGLDRVEA